MRVTILALLACAACGSTEFDSLEQNQTSAEVTFVCTSGELVSFPVMRMTGQPDVIPGLDYAMGCLGVSRMCPVEGGHPGDPSCQDVTLNKFAGTCVERFFDCYRPSGQCSATSDRSLAWSSGHTSHLDYNGRLTSADAEVPCVLIDYDGSNGLYLRERN